MTKIIGKTNYALYNLHHNFAIIFNWIADCRAVQADVLSGSSLHNNIIKFINSVILFYINLKLEADYFMNRHVIK